MIRLPDRVYAVLERVYLSQRVIRRRELKEAVAREDAALRAYYDRMRAAHAAGRCGGQDNGCCYVPCVKPVG